MGKYHKYVFDENSKSFVGEFEKMYSAEEDEGFDSWNESNIRRLRYQFANVILQRYNFNTVLDIGCGKGTYTQFLKKENNRVLGIDISATAIRKAKIKYPDIEFKCMDLMQLDTLGNQFTLVTVMGVFAYVKEWKRVLQKINRLCEYLYIGEYIPRQPIGFIKSSDDLNNELEKKFKTINKLVLDDEHYFYFCRRKK